MDVKVQHIGQTGARVVVIDDFLIEASRVVDMAAACMPFPPEGQTAYPGRRRHIGPGDPASPYVMGVLQKLAPVIGQAFDVSGFGIVEASFSLVTTPPDALSPVQRLPHFDWADPRMVAVLHHLHHLPDTGTAFYRHIASGIERVDAESAPRLRQAMRDEDERMGVSPGFAAETNDRYEKIFHVEARFNRLVIYQGALLHSGYIPPDFTYSDDPRTGRLTGNIFVRLNDT
ncbi:DUF6445 family protein [Asticcacaulis excentricus]|uniref:Uncharacterized protein n=1 Tax=Asticcacaulis excentricus (strain ATCC 15261 / DSM 4724 / KCTC 12464 / NCIMB 9791 / VKM B-1370 / CB 48) TaxID=573065 RepID=E8RTX3_ASTEC|nr:DUF6445 family protein [Asticcacaulis excentricus]ADU14944.1 hypothetical protein Astex_3310 [Asticcacaulis excentricus CB 48]